MTALATAALAFTLAAAGAQEQYVHDNAGMFKPETITAIDERVGRLERATGRAITVITVATTGATPVDDAAIAEAKERKLNGAIIYIAKGDRKLSIAYGKNTVALFPPSAQTTIKQSLRAWFKAGDYDGGIIAAVNGIADTIQNPHSAARATGDLAWAWVLVPVLIAAGFGIAIIAIVFAVIRAVTRQAGTQAGQSQQPGQVGQPVGGSGFGSALLGGAVGGYIGTSLADRDAGSAPASGASDSGSSLPSDDGGGFSDSGGSGDFSSSDSGGGGGGDSSSW